jgi:hypothetical protein
MLNPSRPRTERVRTSIPPSLETAKRLTICTVLYNTHMITVDAEVGVPTAIPGTTEATEVAFA